MMARLEKQGFLTHSVDGREFHLRAGGDPNRRRAREDEKRARRLVRRKPACSRQPRAGSEGRPPGRRREGAGAHAEWEKNSKKERP
jgi:hypothetical protein